MSKKVDFTKFKHPYKIKKAFAKRSAYFCMEYAIDQSLKIYSGGLGYLAGSHMRSAHDLGQAMIGIGILWKYGYYDQGRDKDQFMKPFFVEKTYSFLENTGIQYSIIVNNAPVQVKVMYLPPSVFGSAPLFLLTTDIEENDYLSRCICNRLYDSNVETKVAQYQLLGIGGAKLLEHLNYQPEVFHLNEAHGLPAAFYEYKKHKSLEQLRSQFVFTTHTPVAAGNEKHDVYLLQKMGFFSGLDSETVRDISGIKNEVFDQTLVALRVSGLANGVSRLHGEVARSMWSPYPDTAPITHVTNSQNKKYWVDPTLEKSLVNNDDLGLIERKLELKRNLFQEVANQTGKLFNEHKLTIVWARRFAGYKRANLLAQDIERFHRLIHNSKYPVQIIWAGKPYPMDYNAISMFNQLIHLSNQHENLAVLTGYELNLSKLLKQGSDIWLNTPRVPREASGTSGMTAAMNASVNFSTNDGWIPEFAKHGKNSFVVPVANPRWSQHEVDNFDRDNCYRSLEEEILPTYYDRPKDWWTIVKNSMNDVIPFFDSDRMATEYYENLFTKIGNKKKVASR